MWGVALAVLCLLAVVGRGLLLLEERREHQRAPLRRGERGEPLDLRAPRDLLIVVAAILVGAASVIVLLAHALHR
jgi:hypothetical protein